VSVKVHFLHSHVNYFPENLEAMIEEQGESRYKNKDIKPRYKNNRKDTRDAGIPTCWQTIAGA